MSKPKALTITTSPHLSPEVLSATTVTAPVSSSVLHHHHHYNDVTSQDDDKLKRKKRKTKKQKDDVFFCNFPNHEGLVSRDLYMVMEIKLVVVVVDAAAAAVAINSSFSLRSWFIVKKIKLEFFHIAKLKFHSVKGRHSCFVDLRFHLENRLSCHWSVFLSFNTCEKWNIFKCCILSILIEVLQ